MLRSAFPPQPVLLVWCLLVLSGVSVAQAQDDNTSPRTWTLIERRGGDALTAVQMEAGPAHEVQAITSALEEQQVQRGDTLHFRLPGAVEYKAVVTATDLRNTGTLQVRARPARQELDFASVSFHEGQMHVIIAQNEAGPSYEIRFDPLRGRHVAIQHEALHDPLGCGVDHAQDHFHDHTLDGLPQLEVTPQGGVDDEATISVMVVYTPNAEVWALQNSSGIENVVSQAMGLAQEAMDNSDVGITLDLVYAGAVDYIESNNSFQNLQRLTSTSDGYMEEVHDLRDEYGADLVALFTRTSDVGGVAWVLNSPTGRPSLGFSVSRVQSAANSFVHAHELGHNMGNMHSRNQQNNAAGASGGLFEYSTGWRWAGTDGTGYASVMTYTEGDQRAPLFSNPDIDWGGNPSGAYTGVHAPADNARSMREIKHVVAAYRNPPIEAPQLFAGEVTPPAGTPRDVFTFTVQYQSDAGLPVEDATLHVNGSERALSVNSFDWEDGVTLSATVDNLDTGTYPFYFTGATAEGAVRDPVQGTYQLEVTRAAVDVPLVINNGVATRQLAFGLDPEATSALDPLLGEDELPPFPSDEALDARFVSPELGEGTLRDYRTGGPETDGVVAHELRIQSGEELPFTIAWEIPNGVEATLTDVETEGELVSATLQGHDSLTVAEPSVERLRLTVTYSLGGNRPPVVVQGIGNQLLQLNEGVFTVALDSVFSDPDEDVLNYRTTAADTTVAQSSTSATQLTVDPRGSGETTISVWASDGRGGEVEDRFAVDVNAPPTVIRTVGDRLLQTTDPPFTVALDTVFIDPEGDAVMYAAEAASGNVATATLDGPVLQVAPQEAGTTPVALTATDDRGGYGTHEFTVTVNAPPQVATPLDTLIVQLDATSESIGLDSLFASPSESELSYAVDLEAEGVAGAALTGSTLTLTPLSAGTTTLHLEARDAQEGTAHIEAILLVNTAPRVVREVPDQVLTDRGEVFRANLDTLFTDDDGHALSYAYSTDVPAVLQASLDGSVLTLRPNAAGSARIILEADDGFGGQAQGAFDVRAAYSLAVGINRSFGTIEEAFNYRLVALPGVPEEANLGATVDGPYEEQWRAFWDNGQPGDDTVYLEEYDGSSTFDFAPGRGFWLLSEADWTVSMEVDAAAVGDEGAYALPVHDGWNIISNPFERDVPWSAVRAANDVDEALWRWNGAFNQTATFASATEGTAFYFFNAPDAERTRLQVPYPTASVASGASATAQEEAVSLAVRGPQGVESEVRVLVDASPATDPRAHRRVAPPGHFLSSAIRIAAPDMAWDLMQQAVALSGQEGVNVPLRVRQHTNDAIMLAMNVPAAFPHEVALMRNDTQEVFSTEEGETVPVATQEEETHWTLLIGTASYIEEQTRPAAVELMPGFPNPFGHRVTLPYLVPEPMEVTIEVFNVLGQQVARIAHGVHAPGRHEVTWDGTTASGRAGSGLYIVRLQAENETHTQNIMLVR